MSLAAASSGAPEAKKFRFSLPTQVVVNEFDFESKRIKMEEEEAGDVHTEDVVSVCENISENGLDLSSGSKLSPSMTNNNNIKSDFRTPSPANSTSGMAGLQSSGAPFDLSLAMFFQQANAIMKNVSKEELKATILAQSRGPAPAVPPTPPAPIPGALAVAASPAAQLFSEDDWSWHRNPAAAIRSGGTNKQTPVWKYFVYNKAENLSRCIIGDCTYMLKGPHTSTLACHLKKHPVEYAEFQKLKQDYTRERNAGQLNPTANRMSQSSSAESSASHTPISSTPAPAIQCSSSAALNGILKLGQVKNSDSLMSNNSIFGGNRPASNGSSKGLSKSKPSSMSDILNLLNARANANATTQDCMKLTTPPVTPTMKSDMPESNAQAGMMPFPAALMAAQANNPFLLNFLKHNASLISNLSTSNNNNSLLAQNNNNVNYSFNGVPKSSVSGSNNTTSDSSKKWQRQDRKQKEMEVKLGLALASAQLPTTFIKNPFFRDFIETAQPKFVMPQEVTQIDDLINTQYQRTVETVKTQLASANKVTIIVDVLKIGRDSEDDENASLLQNLLPTVPVMRLCVSAAYFCVETQAMEVVLLGVRKMCEEESIDVAAKSCVEQVLTEFELDWSRVARVVASGLSELRVSSDLFPRQLVPYNQKLTQSLASIFDASSTIVDLKKKFYTMVYRFLERPEAMAQLSTQLGHVVAFPVNEPFAQMAEWILKIKGNFLTACVQQPIDNPIPMLSEHEWEQLESAVQLLNLFRVHMSEVHDGKYATIDKVVPSLMQLKVSLERDFAPLGNLPHLLLEDLYKRAEYILDSNCPHFDGSFIQATALNHQLAMLLDDAQMAYAKNSIEKLLAQRMRLNDESAARRNGTKHSSVDALLAAAVERKNSNVSSMPAMSPPLSSASSTTSEVSATPSASTASSLYPDLIQAANQRRKQFQDRAQNGKNVYAEAMVQSYFDDLITTIASSPCSTDNGLAANANLPPLQFWQLSSVKYAQLSDIALELLSIPSCTVSTERIFNLEGSSQTVPLSREVNLLRAMEEPERMERDALLRFNRNFIPKSF